MGRCYLLDKIYTPEARLSKRPYQLLALRVGCFRPFSFVPMKNNRFTYNFIVKHEETIGNLDEKICLLLRTVAASIYNLWNFRRWFCFVFAMNLVPYEL